MSAVRHGPQGQASLSHASERDAMGRELSKPRGLPGDLGPLVRPPQRCHRRGAAGAATAQTWLSQKMIKDCPAITALARAAKGISWVTTFSAVDSAVF